MKIVKVYKESLPKLKLVGKRYTSGDRDEQGTYARYWQQCFQENWANIFKQCKGIPAADDNLVGAMRMAEGEDSFEYWIGACLALDAEVPSGFESVEIPAGELGICWLSGNGENGELYSMEASDMAMAALAEREWKFSETGWFFERYDATRFTTPDENGNVILDICAYLI